MKFKIYYEYDVYNLDEQRGKGKIYKIINKSKPTRIKKLFSKKSFAHVPSGTYEFYIDGYTLYLTYLLSEINLLFYFLKTVITQNANILFTINYEGPCSYVIAMPLENDEIRLIFLDRPEAECRNWENRYRDDELNNTTAVKDLIISKYELIKQFNNEFKMIYNKNKYYLSEEYKEKCKEKNEVVYQEYSLETFKKFIPIFDEYLRSKDQSEADSKCSQVK